MRLLGIFLIVVVAAFVVTALGADEVLRLPLAVAALVLPLAVARAAVAARDPILTS